MLEVGSSMGDKERHTEYSVLTFPVTREDSEKHGVRVSPV